MSFCGLLLGGLLIRPQAPLRLNTCLVWNCDLSAWLWDLERSSSTTKLYKNPSCLLVATILLSLAKSQDLNKNPNLFRQNPFHKQTRFCMSFLLFFLVFLFCVCLFILEGFCLRFWLGVKAHERSFVVLTRSGSASHFALYLFGAK